MSAIHNKKTVLNFFLSPFFIFFYWYLRQIFQALARLVVEDAAAAAMVDHFLQQPQQPVHENGIVVACLPRNKKKGEKIKLGLLFGVCLFICLFLSLVPFF